MKRSVYVQEASKLISERLKRSGVDGYSIVKQTGIFTSLHVIVKGPEGLLKEYSLKDEFAMYGRLNCSVSKSVSELIEVIIFDINTLSEYMKYRDGVTTTNKKGNKKGPQLYSLEVATTGEEKGAN